MTQPNSPASGGNPPRPEGQGWQSPQGQPDPAQGWRPAQGSPQWQPQPGQGHGQAPTGQPQPGQWQGPPPQPPYGQQPSGPQFGQPPYAQYQAAPTKPGKAPKILIVVGAVLAGIGAGLVALFAFQLSSVIPNAADLTVIDGPTEVVVSGQEMKVIYSTDPNTGCNVTSPGMTAPDLELGMDMNFSLDGMDYAAIGKIGGPGEAEGAYLIECDSMGVVAGPAIDIQAIGLAVVYAVLGFGSLVLGVILLIVGLVLRGVQRKRAVR